VADHPFIFGAKVSTKLNEFDFKIFYGLCRASRELVCVCECEFELKCNKALKLNNN